MKRSYVLVLMVLTAFLSIAGTFLIMENKHEKEISKITDELDRSLKEDETKEKFISIVDASNVHQNTFHANMLDEWKSDDEPFIDNLVQEVMQDMAHQKIVADTKELSIMITPERIDTLIQMVEENKDKFEHDETYLEILNRWREGDFSIVDYDHNVLMYIQSQYTAPKSISGLAKDVATKEQEINYILHLFDKDVDDVFGSTEK
jgi:uncharacterized protein YbcI